ncbi:MAG: LysR family transcriptional regulator [Hyphomonadaceae bacterium]
MRRLEEIDLNLLLLLHWLLEERNVTAAAKRVGLSQPAASRSLQRLRTLFGDELLVRSGRTYTLSRLAASLQPDLALTVSGLRRIARAEDTFVPADSEETVVIACNDYLARVCANIWTETIAAQAPNMRSSWRPLDLSVMEALASGQVDLVIAPDEARANAPKSTLLQDVVIRPLFVDSFVIFGNVEHQAMRKKSLSPETFAGIDQILVSPDGAGESRVDRALQSLGLSRTIRHRAWSFSHAADLALATESLVILPKRLAELRSDGCFRKLPFPHDDLSNSIAWHATRTSDMAHKWVREQFQSFFLAASASY